MELKHQSITSHYESENEVKTKFFSERQTKMKNAFMSSGLVVIPYCQRTFFYLF